MAKGVRFVVAIVSLALLVSVPYFEQRMPAGRFLSLMTITKRGTTGRQLVAVKQHRERIGEAMVTYPTGHQHLSEIYQSGCYQVRTLRQVEVEETDSKKKGSRGSFTQRKLKSVSDSKRSIPGGPDGQHHNGDGK